MPNLAGQDDLDLAPAEAPATEALDIEKIKQEAIAAASAAFEDRIKGFQRLMAERDNAITNLSRQLEEARLSTLGEEEREAELARREQAEVERLRAENELLKLMPDFPDELPLFQRLLAAPDAKTQLELIRELRKAAAPANPAPVDPGLNPAPVDPNNPASDTLAGGVYQGVAMDDDLAERLLRSTSRMR